MTGADTPSGTAPRTVRLIQARRIPLPADVVFAALIDLRWQRNWIVATRVRPAAVDSGEPPAPGAGSTLLATTGIGGIGVTDTMRVTEYRRPRRWRVQHIGRVRGWGEWGVLPDGAGSRGCRVYWAEEFPLPAGALGRIGAVLGAGLIRAGIRVSLARLARGLRAGTIVPGA